MGEESANGENWGPCSTPWLRGVGRREGQLRGEGVQLALSGAPLQGRAARFGRVGPWALPGSEKKAPNGETCGLELKYPAIRVFEGVKFHVVAGRDRRRC